MARLNISTVVASLCLFSQIATAQYYPRNTALNGTITKASHFTTSSSSDAVESVDYIDGPFILAYSSTWSQVIFPTTVGTVMVTVNEAINQTFSTTIYHTDYERNGSATLLTRTDTDAAGTITQVVTDDFSQTTTITYPTNYFEATDSLTWTIALPTVVDNNTCCSIFPTLSATPTHTPFVQIGSLDTQDPRGWLYSLVGGNAGGEADTILGSKEVSSLWSGQTLSIDHGVCGYTMCDLSISSALPATPVEFQSGAILATSTTTISSLPAGSSTSPEPASSQPAISPATSTPTPEQTSTTQSAGDGNTSSGSSQQASSTPQSTQVSAAPPQSSAVRTPSPQSQQASNTRPQSGSVNSKLASAPAQISGGSTATSNPSPSSNFVTAGLTIFPGSSITLGSGTSTTIVAVQTSGSNTIVVVGGSSSFTLTPAPAATLAAVIMIGSSTISANSASQYIIESQTLVPGSSITLGSGISTTIIALQTSGSNTVLVVGSSSSTLVKAPATIPPPITMGSSVITADSASHYVIAGQTLAPGGSAIVVDGTTISLASGGTQLIEGMTTMAESMGIGGVIWSIFGGREPGTATSNAAGSTGSLNSSTSALPTFQQSSGVARLRPFWAAVVVPAVVVPAVLCSAALMWSSYG